MPNDGRCADGLVGFYERERFYLLQRTSVVEG